MKNLYFSLFMTVFFCLSQMEINAQSNEISIDINSYPKNGWIYGASLNYYLQTGMKSYYGVKFSYSTNEAQNRPQYSDEPYLKTAGINLVKNHQFEHGKRRRLSFEYGLAMAYQEKTEYFHFWHPLPNSNPDFGVRRNRSYSSLAGIVAGIKYDWRILNKFRIGAVLNAQYLYNVNTGNNELSILPTVNFGYKW